MTLADGDPDAVACEVAFGVGGVQNAVVVAVHVVVGGAVGEPPLPDAVAVEVAGVEVVYEGGNTMAKAQVAKLLYTSVCLELKSFMKEEERV